MILGLCEGVTVCGMTVVFHYLLQMSSEMGKVFAAPFLQREVAMMQPAGGYESERMQAFAEAVDELSVAFAAIGKKEELSSHESVTVLEEEITAKSAAAVMPVRFAGEASKACAYIKNTANAPGSGCTQFERGYHREQLYGKLPLLSGNGGGGCVGFFEAMELNEDMVSSACRKTVWSLRGS